MGFPQQSLEDALAASELAPDSLTACLLTAQSYSFLEQSDNAYRAYEMLYNLATAQGKDELAASARVSMAMIMQSMSLPTFPVETLTPAPN